MRVISAVRRGAAVLTLTTVLLAPAVFADDLRMQPPIPAASTSTKTQPVIGLAKIAYLVFAARFGLPMPAL
jgi:hypothetical protein